MTFFQIERLIHLHEKVERHLREYRRFSTESNTQSKALCHLRKAAQLYSQISAIVRDSTPVPAYTGKENIPVETHPRL